MSLCANPRRDAGHTRGQSDCLKFSRDLTRHKKQRSIISPPLAPFFEFGYTVDHSCVHFSLFSRLLRSISVITMVHIDVQWIDAKSGSVIRENRVILAAKQELQEGMAIQVQFGKNSKGRLAVLVKRGCFKSIW